MYLLLKKLKRYFNKISYYIPKVIVISLIVVVFLIFVRIILPVYRYSSAQNITPQFIYNLMLDKEEIIKNTQGRTDIALLGISGGSHEGSDLTDSIIYISIDYHKKDAVILSIPRDLWIPGLKAKINSAYHYGEEKKQGGGLILVK